MTSRLIAYSLFGPDPKYREGMLENLQAIDHFYPAWNVVIYCDRLNHDALLCKPLSPRVEVVLQQEMSHGLEGALWRFHAAGRPGVQILLFRDCDSRFTTREVEAVGQWLKSGYDTHIIRDHPYHRSPVMAGLFGVKGSSLKVLATIVEQRAKAHRLTEYGDDQLFLSEEFYPRVRAKALVHTDFVRYFPEQTQPMMPDRCGESFVGAYAFLTANEQARYLAVRRTEPPITLLPPDWHRVPLLKVLAKWYQPVRRIRHGCHWWI